MKFLCIGNGPFATEDPALQAEHPYQVTLVPAGQGPELCWGLGSCDPMVYGQFQVGKTYDVTLTAEEVPDA